MTDSLKTCLGKTHPCEKTLDREEYIPAPLIKVQCPYIIDPKFRTQNITVPLHNDQESRQRSSNASSISLSSTLYCSLTSAASQSLMQVSISTISDFRFLCRFLMILPVILKVDSKDMIDTGTVKISLAMIESTGYVSLC